jgi:hypothetical protein
MRDTANLQESEIMRIGGAARGWAEILTGSQNFAAGAIMAKKSKLGCSIPSGPNK